jgi:hypothetical protein
LISEKEKPGTISGERDPRPQPESAEVLAQLASLAGSCPQRATRAHGARSPRVGPSWWRGDSWHCVGRTTVMSSSRARGRWGGDAGHGRGGRRSPGWWGDVEVVKRAWGGSVPRRWWRPVGPIAQEWREGWGRLANRRRIVREGGAHRAGRRCSNPNPDESYDALVTGVD